MSVHIIAEIGINHNGDLDIAKKLIQIAAAAGCDSVKFQKRNPDVCVPEHQKSVMRDTPWGKMTYLEYKFKTEFSEDDYDQIDKYCNDKNIKWFSSVWDKDSVDFMTKYTDCAKVPSALLVNDELLTYTRKKNKFFMLSTGMSNQKQIENAIKIGNPDLIFHTNSTYPSMIDELNLQYIKTLLEMYPEKHIGYSGHEFGLVPTFTAVAFGASYIERHITLDRTMWGSDQFCSIEPVGLIKLVKGIRAIEKSIGHGGPREIIGGEISKLKSLRGDG